jgi:hypothetical protein
VLDSLVVADGRGIGRYGEHTAYGDGFCACRWLQSAAVFIAGIVDCPVSTAH